MQILEGKQNSLFVSHDWGAWGQSWLEFFLLSSIQRLVGYFSNVMKDIPTFYEGLGLKMPQVTGLWLHLVSFYLTWVSGAVEQNAQFQMSLGQDNIITSGLLSLIHFKILQGIFAHTTTLCFLNGF